MIAVLVFFVANWRERRRQDEALGRIQKVLEQIESQAQMYGSNLRGNSAVVCPTSPPPTIPVAPQSDPAAEDEPDVEFKLPHLEGRR